MAALLPFTLLTGYLGSGKTTLLNRLLQSAQFRNSLVIINELADLALDGMRLTDVDVDYVVLSSGCVCCTTRADLTSTVSQALFRRAHGLLPPFERFVLETTGAADPYALIGVFGSGGSLSHLCSIEQVITTVDGLLGAAQLDDHPEALAGVLAADHLVVTKTDLLEGQPLALRERLVALNPLATLSLAPTGLDLDALMSSGLRDARTGEANWEKWLRTARFTGLVQHRRDAPLLERPTHHPSNIAALALVLERPVDYRAWSQWVEQYVQRYGKRVLRLKAVLFTNQFATPIAFDAVRDIVHAPTELDPRAVPDRRSRVVLLCQDIAELELRLLEAAVGATQLEELP